MSGLIGLDWGTSSLRAYWLDDAGRLQQTRTRPRGVRQLPTGGFDAALAEVTHGWPALPRLARGMIGSRGGWLEVPYKELPAETAQIGRAAGRVQAGDGADVHIVPGLSNPQGPDVMRGEETQLVGALSLRPALMERSVWIFPGTHSKWVSVRDGSVVDFCTLLTGELFTLLRRHSILGSDDGAAADDPDAFARSVIVARDSGAAGILSRLFSARTLMLDGVLGTSSVPACLSGLLLGEELRSCLATAPFNSDAPASVDRRCGAVRSLPCRRAPRRDRVRRSDRRCRRLRPVGSGAAQRSARGRRARCGQGIPPMLTSWLTSLPLVAILRGIRPDEVAAAGNALGETGFRLLEVTLNSPQPFMSIRTLSEVPVLPVSGISTENMAPWVSAGAQGFGIGPALYAPGINTAEIGRRARALVQVWSDLSATKPREARA
ncbi:MAG: 2-dehydro-3-deoxygalactonokinase [Rhodanobacter sp.]